MNYTVNFSVGYEQKDIKETKEIKDSTILVYLDSSVNKKLFEYYYYLKAMILNNNRVIIILDNYTCGIEKQLCMLMVSYNRYDIYRVLEQKDLTSEYIESLLERTPTIEEVEQFIGCDISMYANINEVLTEMSSLYDNPEALSEFIAKNLELLENTVNVIDFLKANTDNNSIALNNIKEKLSSDVEKLKSEISVTSSKLRESNYENNLLNTELSSIRSELVEYKERGNADSSSTPKILSYSTLNINTLSHRTGAVLYFKEFGKLRYINSFILSLCELIKVKGGGLSYKLLIYDTKVALGTYKPLSYLDRLAYTERKSMFLDAKKNERIVVTEPSSDILSDILKSDIDIVIIYDRLGINRDLISGAMVYKYNVVSSMGDYRTLKSLEPNISDDFIIAPPYVSSGVIGLPEFVPEVMARVRNSPNYKNSAGNPIATLVQSYASLVNPNNSGVNIINSIFERINIKNIASRRV